MYTTNNISRLHKKKRTGPPPPVLGSSGLKSTYNGQRQNGTEYVTVVGGLRKRKVSILGKHLRKTNPSPLGRPNSSTGTGTASTGTTGTAIAITTSHGASTSSAQIMPLSSRNHHHHHHRQNQNVYVPPLRRDTVRIQDYERQIQEMKVAYETELKETKAACQQQIQEMKVDYETKLSETKGACQQEMDELKLQHHLELQLLGGGHEGSNDSDGDGYNSGGENFVTDEKESPASTSNQEVLKVDKSTSTPSTWTWNNDSSTMGVDAVGTDEVSTAKATTMATTTSNSSVNSKPKPQPSKRKRAAKRCSTCGWSKDTSTKFKEWHPSGVANAYALPCGCPKDQHKADEFTKSGNLKDRW